MNGAILEIQLKSIFKMKKGQVSPIFTWIFVLILAISILFFGIKTVRQGESLKDEVLLVDFYKNLEKRINNYYYLDMDSSGTEEFILPSGVKEVCFTKNENLNSHPEKDYLDSLKIYSNIFVLPKIEFKENRVNITNFFVDINPFCPPVLGGRLNIKLTNEGIKGVKIEQ
jgi:hypothetical protein